MGLVVLSWWIPRILMGPIRKSKHILMRTKSETGLGITRTTLLSMCIIVILISTIVLWQVAFLVSWSIHIATCATHLTSIPTWRCVNTSPLHAIPFSLPEPKNTNTSIPARCSSLPAAPHMALSPHGARTGSMDAYAHYGRFRHRGFYSWGLSQCLVSSAVPRPCRFCVLDARCAVPIRQVCCCA